MAAEQSSGRLGQARAGLSLWWRPVGERMWTVGRLNHWIGRDGPRCRATICGRKGGQAAAPGASSALDRCWSSPISCGESFGASTWRCAVWFGFVAREE